MSMIFCRECGYKHSDKAKACPKCGYSSLEDSLSKQANRLVNGKSMLVYLLLAWLLGVVGAHRFYVGKTNSAIVMLLCGTFGWLLIIPGIISVIWALVDIIVGICNISTPEKVLK
jgi:TM2 domain-containing membrane protein YozV